MATAVTATDTQNTAAKAAYNQMMAEYKALQNKAYTSHSVETPEVVALGKTINSYLSTYVTDATSREAMAKKFNDEISVMKQSTDLYAESNGQTLSNNSWDETRQDIQELFATLAPTGGDAVYDPTAVANGSTGTAAAAGTAGTAAPAQLLSSTGGVATSTKTGTSLGGGAVGKIGSMPMVSLDAIIAKNPVLAPFKQYFLEAEAQYKIPAQLLAAQAMQESHGNPNEKNGGMMQFIPSTWASVGDPSIPHGSLSAANVKQQIMAAAKYDVMCMNDAGGNLEAALRTYNGPVANGGTPYYQAQIAKWLVGKDGYMD